MEKTNQAYSTKDQKHYLQTFRRYSLALERGSGSKVWDVEGNEYIDVLGGIAVNSLGHCHPHVVKAITEQAAQLIHISNFYVSKPQVQLAEKLTALSSMDRVFFANSGAESVEGAFKIARKYGHSQGRGGTIISFEGSFHGRTLATIATGKPEMQKGFGPMPQGFKKVPFNDFDALENMIDGETAGIIIEPIQGEGGIRVADPEFVKKLRRLCDAHKIALIFDEIQCGMGRTGKMFAKEHFGVEPDIMTLAKALGGGVPIGAILSNDKVSSAIEYGDHGTTFGGNPLACAAALATIEVLEEKNLLMEAEEKGTWLTSKLKEFEDSRIKDIRGLGLMIGVEFDFETKPLVQKLMEKRILANATAGNVLRLVPPLNISYEELEQVLAALKATLKDFNN